MRTIYGKMLILGGLLIAGHGVVQGGNVAVSTNPPAMLLPTNCPQIVLLTFDDSVTQESYDLVQRVLTNRWNPNGRPIQATFFVPTAWSDYWLINRLYAQGHEIGLHSMGHATGTNTDLRAWRAEIVGARHTLSTLARIPRAKIRGSRAPELAFNEAYFQAVKEQGLAYDASVAEEPGVGGLSESLDGYIWPYSLHDGVQQVCLSGIAPTGRYEGVYEIPLWSLVTTNDDRFWMDPPMDQSYDEALAMLTYSFEERYYGNRAPMCIALHPADWLGTQPWAVDALNAFIDMAQSNSNVWFVSMGALVDYMNQPQAAADVGAFAPFMTETNAFCDSNTVQQCVYADGTFRSCAECPVAYPSTGTVFLTRWPMDGGTASVTVVEQWSGGYRADAVISNNTDQPVVYGVVSFEISNGSVLDVWDGSFTNVGSVIYLQPSGDFNPLMPGQTWTIGFSGTRTGSPAMSGIVCRLFGVTARRPLISQCQGISNSLTMRWDESAFGYRIETSSNCLPDSWLPVTDVYGSTGWNQTITTNAGPVFYRVRAIP